MKTSIVLLRVTVFLKSLKIVKLLFEITYKLNGKILHF